MILFGLLCFYDEPESSLAACVEGLARAGVDHVVAVDGAYALYPNGSRVSPPRQHVALEAAVVNAGMAYTCHVPRAPWPGNEVQKRTAMFRLAYALADDGDWFMPMDADQVVTKVPENLKERLAVSEHDVADVRFKDMVLAKAKHDDWPAYHNVRILFRAAPIWLDTNHYTYRDHKDRVLWQGQGGPDQIPALDLTQEFLVEHRPAQRPNQRQLAKHEYYSRRDTNCVERGLCETCGEQATVRMPVGWRIPKKGRAPVALMVELCDEHRREAERKNRRDLVRAGLPPDLKWRERYTPPEGNPALVRA